MTANDWAGIIIAGFTIAGFALAGLRWLIKVEMQTVKHQLSNNGGSSMKDKVDNTAIRVERVENRVDEIYSILIERA